MDAKEYDRIGDLLMQIRSKYEKQLFRNEDIQRKILKKIDELLAMNDTAASWEDKGWL